MPILIFAFLMYRREANLHPLLRKALALVRAAVLLLIVLLLLQPVARFESETEVPGNLLFLVDVSDSMTIRDTRKDTKDLVEAAAALNKVPWPEANSKEQVNPTAYANYFSTKAKRDEVSMASRRELVNGIFRHPELAVFDRLGASHNVRYFMCAEELRELAPSDRLAEVLETGLPQASGHTRLGDALNEAADRYRGSPVSGIVLISDGASNAGPTPLQAARRLKDRGISVHTVGVGLPHPSDVAIRDLIVKEVVFTKDLVTARVRIESSGYEKRTVALRAMLDDSEVARRTVVLSGKPQFEKLSFKAGHLPRRANIRVEVSPLSGEATTDNNQVSQTLRVVEDKIKVLYIEGVPRWEYRYLRAILKRDRRLDVTFLMTQGDRELARASADHIAEYPTDPETAFAYDLVILGDVRRGVFEDEQLEKMEELVRKRGGALLMIAGKDHAPAEYVGTPLENVLPVRLDEGGGEPISRHIHPVLTAAGKQSMVMMLETSDRRNDAIWSNVKPLGWMPRVAGVRRGAAVLAELSDPVYGLESYPLIAWQRYGSGKSMFVASDHLWRLRYKIGDEYHTRFWVQAIQFLGLSRLLGENQQIRIETDRTVYPVGAPVRITVNALDEKYDPVAAPAYTVQVGRVDGRLRDRVMLNSVPDAEGLFYGEYVPPEPGRYAVAAEADQAGQASIREFDVTPSTAEKTETAMQKDLLVKVADITGGTYSDLLGMADLDKRIAPKTETITLAKEEPLWDNWIVLVLFLALVSIEWFVRRQNGLA